MIVSALNSSYSAFQTASRWYWSAPTQQSLSNTAQTIAEVLTVTLLVLSQCYTDCVELVDAWLTLSCDTAGLVITPSEGVGVSWYDVVAMLSGDLAYLQTWLSYSVNDATNVITELYYRVRTVLQ